MPWIQLTPRYAAAFNADIAIKLFPVESKHINLSLSAWQAMGQPSAVAVLFDHERCAIAFRPTEAGIGYKVHAFDTNGRGRPDRVQVNAAAALRAMMRHYHLFGWTPCPTILPLTTEGDLWVAELPFSPDEEAL